MAQPVPLPFADSPRSSVGLEWELALVDADSGELRQAATAVLDAVHADGDDDPLRPQVTGELLLNTIEVSSGRCASVGEAGTALLDCLDRVRAVATPLRIELMGGGTHPSANWATQRVTDKQRYATLIDRTQWWGRQMLIYGVHVHVGIESRDKVLPLSRAMLTVFGVIQSLAASSPRAAVPAAADRGPPAAAGDLGRARAVRRRHAPRRRHRRVQRAALGRPPVAAVRHAGGADRRQRHEHRRGRRDLGADALPRRALHEPGRRRRAPPDPAAVVRHREQVALGALRHGRDPRHGLVGRGGARVRVGGAVAGDARAGRGAPRLRGRAGAGPAHPAPGRLLPAAAGDLDAVVRSLLDELRAGRPL